MHNKPIRLLCLLQGLNGGGAERVMMYLARGLDRTRFRITLALGRKQGPYVPLIPPDIETIDLQLRRSAFAVPSVMRLLRSGRYDLCFSMMAMNLTAALARTVGRGRTPLILGARNHYTQALAVEAKSARLTRLAVRMLYPRAEMIIGVSQGVCDDLVENFGVESDRTRAIPNPIELETIRAAAMKDPAHPWLAHDAERPTLVTVGKLQEAKGHRFLLEAFREVRTRMPARLLILGQGPLESRLTAQIAQLGLGKDVQLVGFQQNPHAFMGRATIFVLSSLWEGFPNVLTEAMACGTPVVSTDCPSGPSEIIRPGINGLLVPVADSPALAKAIIELLEDPVRRAAQAAQALRDVQQYDSKRMIAQYAECFEAVTARN